MMAVWTAITSTHQHHYPLFRHYTTRNCTWLPLLIFPLSYTVGYHLNLMSWLVGCCDEYWPVIVILFCLWMFMCYQMLSHTHRDAVSTHNTLRKTSFAEKKMGSWGKWRSVFNRMVCQQTKTLSSIWLPILQNERNICTDMFVVCN